jgi:hypothetical protein
MFRDSLRFFGHPNIGTHRVSAEKQLTMPPQKRSKKNVPPRPTKRSTIMMKTTESLTFQNLRTSQIKNEGKNTRLSRKQELRRQHTL